MNLVDQLFRETLSTSQAATAATVRYLDALGARKQFATSEEYREHRAAARESMRIARGVAAASLAAYVDALAAQRAEGLAAYLAR